MAAVRDTVLEASRWSAPGGFVRAHMLHFVRLLTFPASIVQRIRCACPTRGTACCLQTGVFAWMNLPPLLCVCHRQPAACALAALTAPACGTGPGIWRFAGGIRRRSEEGGFCPRRSPRSARRLLWPASAGDSGAADANSIMHVHMPSHTHVCRVVRRRCATASGAIDPPCVLRLDAFSTNDVQTAQSEASALVSAYDTLDLSGIDAARADLEALRRAREQRAALLVTSRALACTRATTCALYSRPLCTRAYGQTSHGVC